MKGQVILFPLLGITPIAKKNEERSPSDASIRLISQLRIAHSNALPTERSSIQCHLTHRHDLYCVQGHFTNTGPLVIITATQKC